LDQRYQDYPEGSFDSPTDGFRKDIMRYGWPGTITQSIEAAFNGELLQDPENGKQYKVAGFAAERSRCGKDQPITHPVVVKPPPGHDPVIRELLRAAADAALGINGHYRFFSYSNAAIAEDRSFDGPADSGWAYRTIATVCTSFIWTALRAVGIEIEGLELEREDTRQGAEQDSNTLDGLYLYTEKERKDAGIWLYDEVYDQAAEEGGLLGDLINPFTDLYDDIASQVANCFANDNCDPDSEAWQNPGVGRAVSPDNILKFWDSPETGGVYGYNEPIVYRSGGYMAVTTWQPSEGVGSISGHVLVTGGGPVENASVTILGLELFTDINGRFQDELIPAGTYPIEASKMIDGWLYTAQQIITVHAGQTTEVTLLLEPPPSNFRRVVITGEVAIHDGELSGGNLGTFAQYKEAFLNPYSATQTVELKECVDNEVSSIIKLYLSLLPDNSISITAVTELYDDDGPFGFSCYEGDDVVKTSTNSYVIAPGADNVFIPQVEDSGDWVLARLTVVNEQQP